MTWKRVESEIIVLYTPTILNAFVWGGKAGEKSNQGSAASGNRIKRLTTEGFCVVRMIQVNENESTIEMLIDTKIKQRANKITTLSEALLGIDRHVIKAKMTEKDVQVTRKMVLNTYSYRTLSSIQRCFQRWRPLALLEKIDGRAMGKMLTENASSLHNTKERSERGRRVKLEWFFGEFRSMKLLKKEHPWFETMMEAITIGNGDQVKTTATSGNKKIVNKMR